MTVFCSLDDHIVEIEAFGEVCVALATLPVHYTPRALTTLPRNLLFVRLLSVTLLSVIATRLIHVGR